LPLRVENYSVEILPDPGSDRESILRGLSMRGHAKDTSHLAAVVVVLLVGVTAGTVLLLSKNSNDAKRGPSYAPQAAAYLTPVLGDNKKIAFVVALLAPGGSSTNVQNVVTTTQAATQTAQQRLVLLRPPSSDAVLAAQLKAALASEASWLQTASTVLSHPSSPLLSQLSGIGLDAQSKLQALNLRGAAQEDVPLLVEVQRWPQRVQAAA
jgi:hypothetical protein